ncbi:MAG: LysR family transcriptional regulator [Bacillota bacterium]
MEFRQLKMFLAVAEARNFTRAAEMIDYAQSSITGQISSLESELGTKLFERLGRKVALTREGELFLEYAQKIVKLVSEAKEAVSSLSDPRGTIIIGAPETISVFRLPGLIQEYRKRFPGVDINLKRCAREDLAPWLKGNLIDVAFFLGRDIFTPELVTEVLVFEQMSVLAGAGHPIAKKAPVTPGDMEGQTLILCEGKCSYRVAFEDILAKAGVRPGSVLELGSIEAIKRCVAGGLGITLLPRVSVEEEISRGGLVDLRWDGPEFDINTQIVYHRDKYISPALSALIGLARDMLRN